MKIEKISFFLPEDDGFSHLCDSLSGSEREDALEIIDYYLSMEADASFAFCVTDGALAVRVFDGGKYSFVFPYEISEGADISLALQRIVRYAALEEIEPIFENVPSDSVGMFFSLGFRHINADADSPEGDTYRVTLKNECSLIDTYPRILSSDMELSRLAEADTEPYARLSRDTENNKYWGYDYREDHEGCEDGFFISLAEREFEFGSALSLAIRAGGSFIGEALISSFDYKGGSDISVRILPEHQNKGYASRALPLLFDAAAEMGLVTLYARVYKENIPSLRLFSKDADEKLGEDNVIVFVFNIA